MKIYNWIDSFVDTKDKRRSLVVFFVLIYWLWQTVGQMIFYYQLIQIKEYASLFQFMETMKNFGGSLLVNLLYEVVMRYTLPFSSFIVYVVSKIHGIDFLCIGLTILLWLSRKEKKEWNRMIGFHIVLIVVDIAWILMGLKATSLMDVMRRLNELGYISLGIECIIFVLILVNFYRNTKKILKLNCSRIVNN